MHFDIYFYGTKCQDHYLSGKGEFLMSRKKKNAVKRIFAASLAMMLVSGVLPWQPVNDVLGVAVSANAAAVTKQDTGDQFEYWQVTRGTGIRNHDYDPLPGNMWVMLKPAGITDGLTPIKCVTAEDKRFLYCNVKTLNLLPSVLYAEKAYKADADETILYRHGGRVTECAHSNCHMIKNGIVYTAPTDDKILPGIARAHLVRMCKKLGIGISETPFDIDEMREADEILVTSSSNVCLRVNELDGKPVGGKDPETFERLRSALYKEICDATCED